MAKVATGGDSALLELLDNADENDEVMNPSSQEPYQIKEETFIDMDQDTDQLLSSTNDEESVKHSPFSLAYYVRLFDVDTDEVMSRLAWCMLPRPKFTSNFARKTIKSKPDLYGPFWICITLVFSVAIFGNVASYFQIQDKHWHYDFHKVTVSAAIVFLYASLMPSGIFGILWSGTPKESPTKPSFTELACIFGYSLAPFVPASLLWLIQISMLQWILVLICFLVSGGLLVLTLWPLINEFNSVKTKSYSLIVIILGLNLLLATGFMLCFYHVPASSGSPISSTTSIPTLVKNESAPLQHHESEEAKRSITTNVGDAISSMSIKKSILDEDSSISEIDSKIDKLKSKVR